MNAVMQTQFDNIFKHTPDAHKKEVIADRKRQMAGELISDNLEALMPELAEHYKFSDLQDAVRDLRCGAAEKDYAYIGRKLMILLQDTADVMAGEIVEARS